MKAILILIACAALQAQTVPTSPRIMTSTCQAGSTLGSACSGAYTVTPTKTNDYLNSQGVLFSPEAPYYGQLKVDTLNLNIKHVRSGNTTSGWISAVQDMAASGIKTQYVASPNAAYVVDTTTYWSAKGQGTDLITWLNTSFSNNPGSVIDVIEGPNELDVEAGSYFWHPGDTVHLSDTSTDATWLGLYGINYQAALYAAVKGNAHTSGITVLATAVGFSFPSPFANNGSPTFAGSLNGSEDWGNCHPYANGGNGNGVTPTTYGGTAYYYAYTEAPAQEVDEYPFMYNQCNSTTTAGNGTVFGSIPMAPSEQGFFTGNTFTGVTEAVQAKYYPRIYAEMWRHGMPRTITYRFDDQCTDPNNPQCHWGMMRADLSLKPSYFAMRSMNTLLADTGGSFTPSSFTYSIAVSANGAYTRTNYMHDLVLQKSSGDIYYLFWHEVANAIKQNDDGSQINGYAREVFPLALPVTLTIPTNIVSAQLYTYDANWNLNPTNLTITSHTVSLNAADTISVLRLSTKLPFTGTVISGASIAGAYTVN